MAAVEASVVIAVAIADVAMYFAGRNHGLVGQCYGPTSDDECRSHRSFCVLLCLVSPTDPR